MRARRVPEQMIHSGSPSRHHGSLFSSSVLKDVPVMRPSRSASCSAVTSRRWVFLWSRIVTLSYHLNESSQLLLAEEKHYLINLISIQAAGRALYYRVDCIEPVKSLDTPYFIRGSEHQRRHSSWRQTRVFHNSLKRKKYKMICHRIFISISFFFHIQ